MFSTHICFERGLIRAVPDVFFFVSKVISLHVSYIYYTVTSLSYQLAGGQHTITRPQAPPCVVDTGTRRASETLNLLFEQH